MIFAVRSTCIKILGAEFDVNDLKEELESAGFKKIRSYDDTNPTKIKTFHPLTFDDMIVRGIQDVKRKQKYTFGIKVKKTSFEDELNESDETNHVIHEMVEKHRCMLVIHLCQKGRKLGEKLSFGKKKKDGFFICLDKESLDKDILPDHPKVQTEAKHSLYKITIQPIVTPQMISDQLERQYSTVQTY